MKRFEKKLKEIRINENQWKSTKIYENQWKLIKINEKMQKWAGDAGSKISR